MEGVFAMGKIKKKYDSRDLQNLCLPRNVQVFFDITLKTLKKIMKYSYFIFGLV